jgi:tetratricopeptide (TPR) repeat protein
MIDLAWIVSMLDDTEEALELMSRARALAPDDPYTHYYDALISYRAGDPARALDSLEIAVNKGYSTHMLAAEPLFATLRDDPRFIDIIK